MKCLLLLLLTPGLSAGLITSYTITPQNSRLSIGQFQVGSLYGNVIGEIDGNTLRNIHGDLSIIGLLNEYDFHIHDGLLEVKNNYTTGYLEYSISNSYDTFEVGTFFVSQPGVGFTVTDINILGRHR